MLIEQIYTGCLAQGAYYIESEGEAAIIDPLRESAPYIKKAEANGASIKYVFETHFHADFVSGHVELAEKTGADIVFGPTAETGFTSITAKDNQEFKIGNITIIALHTPGHTMEEVLLRAQPRQETVADVPTGAGVGVVRNKRRQRLAAHHDGHTAPLQLLLPQAA
mgnify:CR=1 FL=1